MIEALSAKANEDFKRAQPNYRESLLAAKRRLNGPVSQLDRVTDAILLAPLPEDRRVWTEKCRRLQTEQDQVEQEIQVLEKNRYNADTGMIEAKTVQEALGRFLDGFDALPFAAPSRTHHEPLGQRSSREKRDRFKHQKPGLQRAKKIPSPRSFEL
jgi:hypothetical protein